ncbi:uncharacterized protein LOC131672452 [Phymastichus coffea]|uniref:uncharacterized protein LOC131672452 n=1 Tax=Phymastichus coffea TaxID=108790 RepID=UPI00273CAB1F|nr:uncharacterized protein LOC131672452 [Phymastichus coffea]
MEECECLCSVYKSEKWNEIKQKYVGKIVIPFSVYGDVFEVNNPLGSHSGVNKEHALYCCIVGLPPEYSSLLENIFLFQLYKSSYKKMINMSKLYNPVMQQICDLQENGIDITVKGQAYKVYLCLFNFSGDNLELHNVLGFHESFNSRHPCRLCYMRKEECQTATKENVKKMRSTEKHNDDVASKQNGVKQKSIFEKLPGFNIFQNVSFDQMHDLLEGICRYEIATILYHLIFIEKQFAYTQLKQRMENFDYHSKMKKNVTPIIKLEHIKNQMLVMSASEMNFLLNNLSLFVGDLVPNNSKAWNLYVSLHKLVSLVMMLSLQIKLIT